MSTQDSQRISEEVRAIFLGPKIVPSVHVVQIPIMVCILFLSVLGPLNTKMILTGVFGTILEVVPVKEPHRRTWRRLN